MTDPAILDVRDLSVIKNGAEICGVPALAVRAGERVGIVGPNGCGKTTLLRVLAGLERDYSGRCRVAVPGRVYVHQTPYLFRGTVLGNACYGLRSLGIKRSDREARARDWLKRLGIGALAEARVERLSGGERKRTALARAMALEPELLLLDEPFAELDEAGRARVVEAFSHLPRSTILATAPASLPSRSVDRCCELRAPARSG